MVLGFPVARPFRRLPTSTVWSSADNRKEMVRMGLPAGGVVVLGGMVVWCMRVFWVEVGVLWGYLEAGMRFDGRGTYLKGWLRRCWVEAVELVGGWGLEWGLG